MSNWNIYNGFEIKQRKHIGFFWRAREKPKTKYTSHKMGPDALAVSWATPRWSIKLYSIFSVPSANDTYVQVDAPTRACQSKILCLYSRKRVKNLRLQFKMFRHAWTTQGKAFSQYLDDHHFKKVGGCGGVEGGRKESGQTRYTDENVLLSPIQIYWKSTSYFLCLLIYDVALVNFIYGCSSAEYRYLKNEVQLFYFYWDKRAKTFTTLLPAPTNMLWFQLWNSKFTIQ